TPIRRRGSYQAICQPRGTIPPRPTSLRNLLNIFISVLPLGQCPPRVHAAALRPVRLEAVSGVHAFRSSSFVVVHAATTGRHLWVGFLFHLNRRGFRLYLEVVAALLCKSLRAVLYHLVLLLMNYLSGLEVYDSKDFSPRSARKAGVPSPRNCGHHPHS